MTKSKCLALGAKKLQKLPRTFNFRSLFQTTNTGLSTLGDGTTDSVVHCAAQVQGDDSILKFISAKKSWDSCLNIQAVITPQCLPFPPASLTSLLFIVVSKPAI